MKYNIVMVEIEMSQVAPARERGLKYNEGGVKNADIIVAPARERGLKYIAPKQFSIFNGRSREGAWIEISTRKR